MAAATSSSQRLPKTSLMQRRRRDAATGRLAPHRGPVKAQRVASSLIGEPLTGHAKSAPQKTTVARY